MNRYVFRACLGAGIGSLLMLIGGNEVGRGNTGEEGFYRRLRAFPGYGVEGVIKKGTLLCLVADLPLNTIHKVDIAGTTLWMLKVRFL